MIKNLALFGYSIIDWSILITYFFFSVKLPDYLNVIIMPETKLKTILECINIFIELVFFSIIKYF